jgi:hypothetical protein
MNLVERSSSGRLNFALTVERFHLNQTVMVLMPPVMSRTSPTQSIILKILVVIVPSKISSVGFVDMQSLSDLS